ncbi:MAG: hypothetical protein M1449_00050 [Candidatus Thermoplasmatota archaeon]|nr:hypothetical protein [Candidatus Thermoplasmatota archaeon]
MSLESSYPQITQMDTDKNTTKSNVSHAPLKHPQAGTCLENFALKYLRLSAKSAD